MRFLRASEIRWYLYRSAAKIEMLYQQIAPKRGGFSGSVALEVPFVKATVTKNATDEPTDDERLDVIEKALFDRGLVGTIHEPKEFFAGEVAMRWGLFDDQGRRAPNEGPLVFFGGVDFPSARFVGLGGSSKHVVGYHGATSTHSRSSTQAVVDWILAGLDDRERPMRWGDPDGEQQFVMAGIAIAVQNLRPPTQRLKFLAKTLLAGDILGHEHITGFPNASGVLGTPLYVTLLDIPKESSEWGLDDKWALPTMTPPAGLRPTDNDQ